MRLTSRHPILAATAAAERLRLHRNESFVAGDAQREPAPAQYVSPSCASPVGGKAPPGGPSLASIERFVGLALDPERARLLVCGNPLFLGDLRVVLSERRLRPDRGRAPGHFACENYW